MSYLLWLRCPGCGRRFDRSEMAYECPDCGGILESAYDLERISEIEKDLMEGKREAQSIWRYSEFLPVPREDAVSLGEGTTPTIASRGVSSERGLEHLFFKNETTNPSFSFKDRGSSVMVSHAKASGEPQVMIDSSGNAASSLSAYAAKAGLSCYIFTPAHASPGKIVQSSFYGAQVIKVDGSRHDAYRAAMDIKERLEWYYCGHVNPFLTDGTKTISHEIAEHFNWDPPDWVAYPVGSGGGLYGCWKGFEELQEIGWVDRTPGLVCVQPEGCNPISRAFERGANRVTPVERAETVAEGLSIIEPERGDAVLKVIRSSGGLAASVSDEEILDASKMLGRLEGLFVEPSSSTALAGILKLKAEGRIDPGDMVVCVLTGSGLKTIETYGKIVKEPMTVKPTSEDYERLASKLSQGRPG